jgi:dipeptidase
MKPKLILFAIFPVLGLSVMKQWAEDNCSSFLATKGTSKDGSVMIKDIQKVQSALFG